MVDEDDGFARAPRRWRVGIGGAVAVAVVAVAVTVGTGMVRTAAEPSRATVPQITAAAGVIYVDVSGAVHRSGLYTLPAGARAVDAIAAAGGFTDDAARGTVNLAREVSDGEQLVVAAVGDEPALAPPGIVDGLIDLNTATTEQLDTLPRIGPALAGRIVAWRETNGRFASVDDLLNVSGIGERMLAGFRDLVRV